MATQDNGNNGKVPQPPANILGAVSSVAMQYGVPTGIWEDVAYVESGYNQNAVGDNGSSFGLFQLHRGGQLPAQYESNPQAVFDPTLNAQIAMPAIANAWSKLSSSFNPNNSAWWLMFAVESGHPGGNIVTPGQAEQNEAVKLMNTYNNGTPGTPTNPIQDAVQNVVQGAVSTAANAVFGPLLAAIPGIAVKAGLFAVALVIMVAGLFLLISQSEQSTPIV